MAYPTGHVEIAEGTVRGTAVDVVTASLAATPTAKRVDRVERTITVEGDGNHLLPAGTLSGARGLLRILDWSVAQLMTLAMALVGNFDAVFTAWRENGGASFALDAGFLAAAARACVRIELAEEAGEETESGVEIGGAMIAGAPELPELRDAMSLAWRVLLVWAAVMALFVVAGWVS